MLHRIAPPIAALLLPITALAAQSPQTPIAGSLIPQFAQALPLLSVHAQAAAPNVIDTRIGSQPLTLSMCEFRSHVLPPGTFVRGQQPETWTWGYVVGDACPTGVQESYLGPVIVNTRGVPTEINFLNKLGNTATTNVLAYKFSTDQTLHWADPLAPQQDGVVNLCNMLGGIPAPGSVCAQNYDGPIAAVPHLHGGEVPPEIDGGPDAWFTSDGLFKGHGYYSKATFSGTGLPVAANASIYRYPNAQQAGPLWFHDHTLGATRLNVFAGLAGAYYIVDPAQQLPSGFPGVADVVPLVLQDRMFDTNGQLFFPADSGGGVLWTPNPEHPYWVPEFVGDTIVVNGKAWPFLEVQPKRYRFLVLNGSNARTYELFLVGQNKKSSPVIWVIGNDDGYLDKPVALDPFLGQRLLILPGERYEIIVDFGGIAPGTNLVLKNTGKTPYPAGAAPQGATLGQILQFRVRCPAAGCPADTSWNPATAGATIRLNQPIARLTNPATGTVAAGVTINVTRQLTLNEIALPASIATDPVTGVPNTPYPGGPVEILVNNTKWSGDSPRTYGDFVSITLNGITAAYSETPKEGNVELWEIVNLTADAHPIHTHLASFQVLNRQSFQNAYAGAYAAAFPGSTALGCLAGTFCPGFGPPLDYRTGNARALGGNPDVVPFLQGPVRPPSPQEVGWKDTVMVLPGFVTRFVVRWAPANEPQTAYPFAPGDCSSFPCATATHGYVWHCHIIDHEDNEMMRPDVIQIDAAASRTFVRGTDF
ncbi:MAG TPA: multicopper oxidase domain-containing protein [Anaeromyxobacter sp.]|nr:multicopper oxidase domain-containing protein [Anaeromyxobacter sp.]